MRKRLPLLILGFLICICSAQSQKKTVVKPGDDLMGIIESAWNGDTIAIEPGYYKASYTSIVVDSSIAIISTSKTEKPKVYVKSLNVTGTNLNIYLEGINFSGATFDSLTLVEDTVNVITDCYLLSLQTEHKSCKNIVLRNCIIRNIARSVIRADRASNTVDSIIVNNCIIYDQRGAGDYGPFRMKSNIGFNNFTIKNSTFYNIKNRFIDLEMVTTALEVIIDQCTFYKWGGGKSGQYLFDLKTNENAVLRIKNSILGKTNVEYVLKDTIAQTFDTIKVNGFRVLENSYIEMTTSLMTPDFTTFLATYANTLWDKTEYNTEGVDAEFAHPDSGDFTLPKGSLLLESSETGGIIGDPRWAPKDDSGIKSHGKCSNLTVWPNPAHNHVALESKINGKCSLYSVTGTLLKTWNIVKGTNHLQLETVPAGVYLIKTEGTFNQATKLIIY